MKQALDGIAIAVRWSECQVLYRLVRYIATVLLRVAGKYKI